MCPFFALKSCFRFCFVNGPICFQNITIRCFLAFFFFFFFFFRDALISGADPGFQVRGVHLKKNAPSGGRSENFGVFRVKDHDFTPKKSYFFQFLGGGGAPGAPPGSAPEYHYTFYNRYSQSLILIIFSIALIHFLHCIFNRIDTFATWSEDLEVRLNAKAYSNKQIIGIMERLAVYRHNTGRVRRLLFNPLPPPPPPK